MSPVFPVLHTEVTVSIGLTTSFRVGMLTTQDKHNLCCQKVARLKVSLAQGVDLGESG